ncbi:transposase [Actinomadura sp. 1N219]|uniref:transposase n=1 Tax=Actinomadura sp. 1N219 TaxID=3375152 RepID=UPI0037A707CF
MTDRLIKATTALAVVTVAAVAALISYSHALDLLRSHGQPDRDAAREVLAGLRMMHPQLRLVWGDSAYAGALVAWARRLLGLTVRIVTERPGQSGFAVLARRWIVEPSLAWLLNTRRNVIDYERKPTHSEAHLIVAAITLMTRRITRKQPTRGWTTNRPGAAQAA